MIPEILPQDKLWYAQLVESLPSGSPCPLFFNSDGTLNREKILDLPAFAGKEIKV